jgi:alkylhydroperoxidase/carboxymuconolactone decarboxylase family protein YurZ
MGQTARFQGTLRKLAMIEEGFAEGEAFVLDPAATSALDPKTAVLLQVAASAAIGSPVVCLEWNAGRALAAGAMEDEIADVLLAIGPSGRARPGRRRRADVAIALGYDTAAALEDPDGC